jgi:hypothetical protein
MDGQQPELEENKQHQEHAAPGMTPVRQQNLTGDYEQRPADPVGGSKFVHRGHPKPIDIGITRPGSVRGKCPLFCN